MISAWGVDHGVTISKFQWDENKHIRDAVGRFKSRLKGAEPKEIAAGVGTVAAGVAAYKTPYALRLARAASHAKSMRDPAKAAVRAGEVANYKRPIDPWDAKGRREYRAARKENYKVPFKDPDAASASRFATSFGVDGVRADIADDTVGLMRRLKPEYHQNVSLGRLAANAPKTDRPLYRGIVLNEQQKDMLANLPDGMPIPSKGLQSWSESEEVTRSFGNTFFKMEAGSGNALNFQKMSHLPQEKEWVTNRPLFKVRTEEDGTIVVRTK